MWVTYKKSWESEIVSIGFDKLFDYQEMADKSIPILICGNKVDLREEMMIAGVKCVNTKTGRNLAQDFNALFYETSSKTGENIVEAILTLTR